MNAVRSTRPRTRSDYKETTTIDGKVVRRAEVEAFFASERPAQYFAPVRTTTSWEGMENQSEQRLLSILSPEALGITAITLSLAFWNLDSQFTRSGVTRRTWAESSRDSETSGS